MRECGFSSVQMQKMMQKSMQCLGRSAWTAMRVPQFVRRSACAAVPKNIAQGIWAQGTGAPCCGCVACVLRVPGAHVYTVRSAG